MPPGREVGFGKRVKRRTAKSWKISNKIIFATFGMDRNILESKDFPEICKKFKRSFIFFVDLLGLIGILNCKTVFY